MLFITLDIKIESAQENWGAVKPRLRSRTSRWWVLFGDRGGKMAAPGGSAAASVLKGLIQQFTAITGEARENTE